MNENLFAVDDWDMVDSNPNTFTLGDLFLGSLRMDNNSTFWLQFTLTKILTMALSNKWAFYAAYYQFAERGIRGGMSQINKRYVKANNMYMNAEINLSKETSYLL